MVVISYAPLRKFATAQPDATDALDEWYEKIAAVDWKNLAELRQTFTNVDYVGNDRYVFNIRGNRYRLVVMIFFNRRTVYIRFVGTHRQYDTIDATTI